MQEKHHSCHARYPLALRFIHVITAVTLLVIFCIASNLFFKGINHDTQKFIDWHQPFALLVLLLTLVRIPLRMTSHMCPLRGNSRFAAYAVEFLLYVCMLGMPITGIMMSSYAGYPIDGYFFSIPTFTVRDPHMHDIFMHCHNYMAGSFVILIAMHVSAALFHGFILKDSILKRMGFGDLFYKLFHKKK